MNAAIAPPLPDADRKLVTPEDLLRMGDLGERYELVDGLLEELNVSTESSHVAGEVLFAIKTHIRPGGIGYVFPADTAFQCFPSHPERVRRPDVAYVTRERLTPDRYHAAGNCRVAPDLVGEVISPNDLAKTLNRKIADWLGAGAQMVWVIDPDEKSVLCYYAGLPERVNLFREPDLLTGDPVIPGFSVPVAELFQIPSAPSA